MTPGRTPLLNGPGRGGKAFAPPRLLPAIGANMAGQAAVAVAQLAVVPAFARQWGPERYGVWLMLFALPAYLVVADLGLTSAAAIDITAAVARGERAAAAATFRAMRTAVRGVAAIVGLAALLVPIVLPGWLAPAQAAAGGRAGLVVAMVGLYGACGLLNGTAAAGLRATGGYAVAGWWFAVGLLAEALVALGLLAAGSGLPGVAAGYLAVRGVTGAILAGALAWRAPWLSNGGPAPVRAHWRRLARPALALAVLPVAQAASLQGTVLAIGTAAGAAAVPAFVALRTLSRVAVQAILLVNHAVLPAVTVAWAQGERDRLDRLVRLSHRATLCCALPGAAMLLVAGRSLVARWTGGALRPDAGLVAAMAAAMLLNALWQPASNLLVAVGRQASFAWVYLAAAAASLLLAVVLAARCGAAGAALALALADGAMVWRVTRASRAAGLPALPWAGRAPPD